MSVKAPCMPVASTYEQKQCAKKQAGQEQGSAVKMKPVFKEAGIDDVWACMPRMRALAQCPSQEWLGSVQEAYKFCCYSWFDPEDFRFAYEKVLLHSQDMSWSPWGMSVWKELWNEKVSGLPIIKWHSQMIVIWPREIKWRISVRSAVHYSRECRMSIELLWILKCPGEVAFKMHFMNSYLFKVLARLIFGLSESLMWASTVTLYAISQSAHVFLSIWGRVSEC